ncbi:hypothetical protein L6164_001194 [Bauhinia variegata]|uniref:Uncharacterized protein n=1 Tax=Bauhinia variegata TaxID=167791 RepID=A0ACB9Q8R9_BAUVA|nr:hypothetical protein L6164_001194 [Bauhinia variegata]
MTLYAVSLNEQNLVLTSISYFGVIVEIWKVNYTKFRLMVFKCKWVDNNSGVQTDELGFTLVDLDRAGYKDAPFIMAVRAKQMFLSLIHLMMHTFNEDNDEDDVHATQDGHHEGIWENIPQYDKSSWHIDHPNSNPSTKGVSNSQSTRKKGRHVTRLN